MTVSLGMPETPPRPLATAPGLPPDRRRRRAGRRRRSGVRAVDDDDADDRHQRDAAADRRAHRDRLPDRAGRLPDPGRRRRAAGDRQEVADPGHRRHPLPAQVRLRRDRRRLRGRAGQPGQHQGVRRQGRGDRQGGERRRGPDPDRRQRRVAGQAAAGEVRQGHARGAGRVGAVGVLAVRGARLPRHQDLGQAQRPGRDGQRLPAARRAVRLPAAPRRHRGRPGLPGHHQVGRRVRRAARRGHRRHDPGLAVGAAGRGGQGRQPDPRVARPASSAGWRSCPARPAAAPRSTSTPWPTR